MIKSRARQLVQYGLQGICLDISRGPMDKPATSHVVGMKTEKAFIVPDALALCGLINELLAPNGVRGLHYLVMTNVRAMQHDNAFLVGGGENVDRRLLGMFGSDVVPQRVGIAARRRRSRSSWPIT
jgi:hypothetical protein